jgi:hypothetical protein
MGFMREAPAPETTEWTITESAKPEVFDPNNLEDLVNELTNNFSDDEAARDILVEYAKSYYSQFDEGFNQERLVSAFDAVEALSRSNEKVRNAMFNIENRGIDHKNFTKKFDQAA